MSTTKATIQQIYRTNFAPIPTDDDYTPPPFTGPQRRIKKLHNFPRLWFTNDIAAIASLGGGATSGVTSGGNLIDTLFPTSTNDTTLASIEYIPPSATTGISYNKKDAEDYIKGIAAVAVMILLLYIVWGVSLMLLRVGRVDCCFRMWCCRKKKKKNSVISESGGGEKRGSEVSSTRAMHDDHDSGEDDNDGESINQDCCCITCRDSIIAKGGCCTHNVFCGWLAGKPPKVPTRDSLVKEKELKNKRLIVDGVKAVGDGVGKAAKGVVGVGKSLKSGGSSSVGGEEEGGADDVVGEAEMAVAAVASDDHPQDTTTKDGTDIVISDEYLQKRQTASRRTMLVIRIIFLLSSALVIIFSIKLCVDGYNGINAILDSTNNGIGVIADHIDKVKIEVDEYIATNEEMKQKKEEWLNRTKSQIEAGEGQPWCPLALMNDGKVSVNLSLAKFLLRGNLFKLALIDKADEVKDQALDAVGGGGVNKRILQTAENVVNTVTGDVTSVAQQVQTTVGSVVQTGENAISSVTGDLTNTACTTVEECQKRSEELGLKFNGTGVFESHGCFSVKGEVAYFGEGTLEQIVSPNLNGEESTLHERVVCKAATAVVTNLVDSAVGSAVSSAVDAGKEKVFTVVTFLDSMADSEGGKVEGILGKVLGLKKLFGEDDVRALVEDDADGDNRIKMLVARLTQLVRSLIVDIIPSDGQRALQSSDMDAITETVVEKDGVKYTILSLSENFTGTDLIINGYNVTKLFTTDLTFEIDVKTLTESVNEKLEDSSSFLLDIFRRLQTALETVYEEAKSAQDSLESIVPYFTVAVVFVAVLIGLTSFFIIGTILAWVGKQPRLFRCANDNIILPIFILVGLLVWIFTVVFLTLGVLMGDYCVVSPDVQMNQIFEQTLANISPIGFKFAHYYFNGCEAEARPLLMTVANQALIGTRVGLDQFFELVNNLGDGPLRRACGLGVEIDAADGDPVNALSVLANALRNHVGGAMSAVITVGKLTLCKSFYPIYSFLVHQVVCTDFINLIGPLLSNMFIISVCSMLMVTMRVAWHELVEDEVEGGKLEDDLGTDEAAQMDAGEAGNDEVVEAEEEKEEPAVEEVEVGADEGN
eukprot:scaffold7522_cov202-Skeletonema_marinoi.AAC.1